jgi:hypothetical protein
MTFLTLFLSWIYQAPALAAVGHSFLYTVGSWVYIPQWNIWTYVWVTYCNYNVVTGSWQC